MAIRARLPSIASTKRAIEAAFEVLAALYDVRGGRGVLSAYDEAVLGDLSRVVIDRHVRKLWRVLYAHSIGYQVVLGVNASSWLIRSL